MAVDSQWANTVLLLPMEGANNSTTILDAKGHTVTLNGGVKLSTAHAPTGCTTSAVFDGNNDYLSISHSDFAFGTGDFAIEVPVYKAGDGATGSAADEYVIDFRTAEPSLQVSLIIAGASSATPNKVYLYVNGSSAIIGTTQMSTSFKMVTLARISGVTRLFIDGVQEGSSYTDTNNYSSTAANIGGRFAANSGDWRSLNGYLGPMRITKNGRGYSTTFTPPTLPFLRPTITGTVYNSGGSHVAKVVTATKRSTLALAANTVSDGSSGVYTLYPLDYSEYIVTEFDTATYPLVDGGSGENAIIYDRVIPGG